MKRAFWLAGAAATVLAAPAMAQTPPGPAAATPSVDAAQQGVLLFEPAFFASSSPSTAFDMIQRVPGFGLNLGDNGTRGFAGAAGNVLIDGSRPASKNDSLDQILRRISASSVERVELIRGGAPGIDMQGQAVVANVVLRRTVTVERVLELNSYIYPDGQTGPLIKGQFSRSEGDNRLEGSFSATTDRTDGTGDGSRRRYDPAGHLIQDADLVRWDRIQMVNATAAMQRLVGGGKLKINGLLGWFGNENTEELLIRSGAGQNNFSDEASDRINGEIGVNWSRPLGPRTELELIGLQRYSTNDYSGATESGGNTSLFTADSRSGESIGRGVMRFRPDDRWAFEGGGEIAYNFLDSATAYEENHVAVALPSASVKVEELRGEVFGQTTWRPGPTFTLEASLRVEVSRISQSGDSETSRSFVYPKPRVQATWTPMPGNQFRLRLEREVGQLDFGDFIASADIDIGQVEAGNPALEPYKAWIIEGVYEHRFWGEGVIDFTWRHARIEDVVEIIPLAGGFDAVGNIGDGRQNFFQTRLTLPMDRLGLPHARFQIRGSWAWSELTDPLTGLPRRFSDQQAFGCGASFNQDLDGGRWSYGFDHGCNVDRGTSYRTREVRRFVAEPFVTLYGQWKPTADLTVRVDLGNATDRTQGYDRDIYAGPRDSAPLAFTESRRTRMAPWLFLQIRKTL